MNVLERFEKFVERLLESPFERLFKGYLHPADLARALAEALETGRVDDGRGGWLAPDYYQVWLSRADYRELHARSAMAQEVAAIKRYLAGLGAEMGCSTSGPPAVYLSSREDIVPGQIEVIAGHSELEGERTASPPKTRPLTRAVAAAAAARWQLQWGEQVVKLGLPVVRLGREMNNDVVIADRTVSRYHAQLRWRNQTYHARNLSRTQPLKVNGRQVRGSRPLKPGDRLELGGVILRVDLGP